MFFAGVSQYGTPVLYFCSQKKTSKKYDLWKSSLNLTTAI